MEGQRWICVSRMLGGGPIVFILVRGNVVAVVVLRTLTRLRLWTMISSDLRVNAGRGVKYLYISLYYSMFMWP